MPLEPNGGGGEAQAGLGNIWYDLSALCYRIASSIEGIPIIGAILAQPYRDMAGYFDGAGDFTLEFRAFYDKAVDVVAALADGSGLNEALDLLWPDWSTFISDPATYLTDLVQEKWAGLQALIGEVKEEYGDGEVHAAASIFDIIYSIFAERGHYFRLKFGVFEAQLFEQAVYSQDQWLMNCFRRFFPWLYPLLDGDLWGWLRGLLEDIGFHFDEDGNLILPGIEDIFQWILDHIPWFTDWAKKATELVLFYAFEGRLPTEAPIEGPQDGIAD